MLGLFAFFAGNLEDGASAWGSALAQGALVALALLAPWSLDPWRLGRGWRWAPWSLAALVIASLACSAVPRAGLLGAVLMPAFVVLPGLVARRLATEVARRRELLGVAVLVIAVAGWALLEYVVEGTPRPARPLGHHNLLATFLVVLLPLTLVPMRTPGPGRWLGGAAGLLAIVTIVATRSLSGTLGLLVALGVVVIVGTAGRTRRRAVLLAAGLILALVAFQGGRVMEIVRGADLSAQVRQGYRQAGLAGIRAAPWLGHGPGSTPWTIAAFVRPIPGVTPPGEALGELHSWPLAVAYELGLLGLAGGASVGAAFGLRRWRERSTPRATGESGSLLVAGLAGLAGGLVAGLGTAEWRVTALPLAVAVVLGACLAGGRGEFEGATSLRAGRFPKLLALLVAAWLLVPVLRANFLYERAVATGDLEALALAVRLDSTFPLYRARLAWVREDADEALVAAQQAGAVPALWAAAADLGQRAAAPWARSAAFAACDLAPLLPVGSWLALVADPRAPEAPSLAAHALAADPRLAASDFWRDHPQLLAAAVGILERDSGLDLGWRQAAVEQLRERPRDDGPTARLGLGFDDEPALAVSSITFRRRPWPILLAATSVRLESAQTLSAALPSAALLPASIPQVLVTPCAPGIGPQKLWKTLRKTP